MKRNFLPYFFLLAAFGILPVSGARAQKAEWHELDGTGQTHERHENAMVKAGDKIIVLGGRGLKPIDIYDTRKKEWATGAQPPLEMHHVQAVAHQGLVYIMAAFTGPYPYETPISHMLIYDPVEDIWAIGPEIPLNRRRAAAGVVAYQDKFYIVNGIINGHTSGWVHWLDEFDPESGKWKVLPDAPKARDHVHAAVIDDQLVVAGGRRSGYSDQTFQGAVKETNVYNFKTGKWQELPSPKGDIPTLRAGAAVAVYQGNLLVMGGESGNQELAHNEVEMLDVDKGSWQTMAPLKKGRHGTQAIYENDVVVIGAGSGNRGGGPELNSFEVYGSSAEPAFASNPILPGKLNGSAEKLVYPGSDVGKPQTFEIENKEGNQGLLLQYIIADTPEHFEVKVPVELPYMLAPGKSLPVEVVYKGGKSEETPALLLVKSLGKSAPLSVPLEVEE